MGEIHRDGIVWKCGKADLPAAIGHMDGLIDRRFVAGAFDHIVGADAAGKLPDDLDGILVVDIDDTISAEFLADRQPSVARSRQDHRTCAERLGYGHCEQSDRPRADHHDALTGHQPSQFSQAIHRRAGGDDQRCLGIAHGIGHSRQRVDMIDGIFGEAAVRREAVGAMALLGLSVIQA
jgi:hypothetical protein